MAAHVTKWKKFGSNSDIDTYTDDSADSGITVVKECRNECNIWLDGTSEIDTYDMDFPIATDLTIVLNGTLEDIDADAGDVDVDMIGSVDGTNYFKMADLVTWNAGGGAQAEVVGYAVYDVDANGCLPYMKIRCTPGGDANGTKGLKINVFPV